MENFFSSTRVNQYLRRLKFCCSFIIIFTLFQTFLWYKLEFMQINYNNSLLVFCANTLLIFSNFTNLVKLIFFDKLLDDKIVHRISCLFYFAFFGFIVNMVETIWTLFGAYLSYFESLSLNYPKQIGITLTFILIFSIFFVIVINTCLTVYCFLMSSKFHTYVKLSVNFGILKHFNKNVTEIETREKPDSDSFAIDVKPCDITNSQDISLEVRKDQYRDLNESDNSKRSINSEISENFENSKNSENFYK